jgi:hypothetical protein
MKRSLAYDRIERCGFKFIEGGGVVFEDDALDGVNLAIKRAN